LNYRPQGSPLRDKVKALFEKRHEPATVGFLAKFLPPDTNISTVDRLTFLSAFARERCTRLSNEEEEEIQAYIQEQSLLVAERRDRPWFLDEDYEDKPLLAENRYIQQYVPPLFHDDHRLLTINSRRIDELPRVAQRALEEIEKQTGFKGVILLGGLTPADNGEINTHTYVFYFISPIHPTHTIQILHWGSSHNWAVIRGVMERLQRVSRRLHRMASDVIQ
jgi:hypothetical protein